MDETIMQPKSQWPWVIGALGIVALAGILSVALKNPASYKEETSASSATEKKQTEAQHDASVEVLALRSRLEAESNYAAALLKLAEIRATMQVYFMNASGEVRAQWSDVQAMFDRAEADLRARTNASLATLSALSARLDAAASVK